MRIFRGRGTEGCCKGRGGLACGWRQTHLAAENLPLRSMRLCQSAGANPDVARNPPGLEVLAEVKVVFAERVIEGGGEEERAQLDELKVAPLEVLQPLKHRARGDGALCLAQNEQVSGLDRHPRGAVLELHVPTLSLVGVVEAGARLVVQMHRVFEPGELHAIAHTEGSCSAARRKRDRHQVGEEAADVAEYLHREVRAQDGELCRTCKAPLAGSPVGVLPGQAHE